VATARLIESQALEPLLAQLSDTLAAAQSLEQLTRPLLELLGAVTGFESTYLTVIDLDQGVQHVQFARNTAGLTIPEGLTVPWADTLCKRALDEQHPIADDVAGRWGDSDAAKALGIQSYATSPVLVDGAVCGTLCAASADRRPIDASGAATLGLFSRLIGQQIERERLLQRLKQASLELAALASTDALTQLPNRRILMAELRRMLARGEREGCVVLVAMIDLDHFKAINDEHGHDIGDAFLVDMAKRLGSALRATDLLVRLGGDEFVAVGPGPEAGQGVAEAVVAFRGRLDASTCGRVELDEVAIDYGGASVGVVAVSPGDADAEGALRAADAAMYEAKQQRRQAVSPAIRRSGQGPSRMA